MLIDATHSALLVIDVQERLLPAIDDGPACVEHILWLLRVAGRIGVPVLACEQYPQGLGPTHPAIRAELPVGAMAEKIHFSAVAAGCHGLGSNSNSNSGVSPAPTQYIVCGTEAHVCVMQTVLDLLAAGKQVFVVAEAVGSRRASDKALALTRMRDAGAVVVSREMVAFEWLRRADTALFREISRAFLR